MRETCRMNCSIFILSAVIFLCGAAPGLPADSLEKIAKKISAGAKELQNKKVAVLPFPYHDGRESKGSTIVSERLTTKLVEQKKLDVIERTLMEKVLKELNLQSSGAIDEQSAKQLGKILGVEAIVSGTLIDLGEKEVEINARLIKTETGQIIVAASGNVDRFWKDTEAVIAQAQEKKQETKAEPVLQEHSKEAEIHSEQPPHPEMAMGDSGIENRPSDDHSMQAPHREDMPPPEDRPEMPPLEEGSGILQGPEDMPLVESGFNHDEIERDPTSRKILEGFRMIRNKEEERAEKHFLMLHENLKHNPRIDAIVRLGYSVSLFEQGKKEKAIRIAKELANHNEWPRIKALGHFLLGRYGENMGEIQAAQKHYLEVIRLTPFQTKLVQIASRHLRTLKQAVGEDRMEERMERGETRREIRKEKSIKRFR